MAAIHVRAVIEAPAEAVWAVLREVYDLPDLAPGFVLECKQDGDVRVVTFDNGAVARELIVDIDDETRRVAYAIVDSPLALTHHHATSQVVDEGEGRCGFEWRADFVPGDREPIVRDFMERGLRAMKSRFEEGGAEPGKVH